jgi:hypothetical protein
VTPRGSANVIWRAFARVLSIELISLFFMHLATIVDRPLLRLGNGRLRLSFVVPMLLLTCRGARTGARREVPLLYVPDGGNVLLIGSNGGSLMSPRGVIICVTSPG